MLKRSLLLNNAFTTPTACHQKSISETLRRVTMLIGSVRHRSERKSLVEIVSSPAEAVRDIKSEQTLMVGGFGLVGVPEALIKALSERAADVQRLTVISNEGGVNDHGLDKMLRVRQIRRFVCSFIGENKVFQKQFLTGDMDVELVPQGTLIEKIRSGGAGIPAFYTSTGVNTLVHLGGEPIRFARDGSLEVQSEPKEVRPSLSLTHHLLSFILNAYL